MVLTSPHYPLRSHSAGQRSLPSAPQLNLRVRANTHSSSYRLKGTQFIVPNGDHHCRSCARWSAKWSAAPQTISEIVSDAATERQVTGMRHAPGFGACDHCAQLQHTSSAGFSDTCCWTSFKRGVQELEGFVEDSAFSALGHPSCCRAAGKTSVVLGMAQHASLSHPLCFCLTMHMHGLTAMYSCLFVCCVGAVSWPSRVLCLLCCLPCSNVDLLTGLCFS